MFAAIHFSGFCGGWKGLMQGISDRDQDSQSGSGSPKLQRKPTQAGSQSLGTKNSKASFPKKLKVAEEKDTIRNLSWKCGQEFSLQEIFHLTEVCSLGHSAQQHEFSCRRTDHPVQEVSAICVAGLAHFFLGVCVWQQGFQ